MPSARTNILNSNTMNAMRHMLDTATRHPFITTGLATGLAFAVAHRHNEDKRPPEPTSPADMDETGSGLTNVVRAVFSENGMPQPTMEGYESAQPAHIQPLGAGYENPRLSPVAQSSISELNLPPVQGQTPMSASPRMSGMQDYRHAPIGRMASILQNNNL